MIFKPLNVCVLAIASMISLSGCSTLPNSGPTAGQIEDAAKSDNQIGFKIIDVTPPVVSALRAAPAPSIAQTWGNRVPRSVGRVGKGDVLQVSIFVAGGGSFNAPPTSTGEASGLGNGNSGGIQSQSMPPLLVDDGGNITIPYAGQLHVAGMTPTQIQNLIDSRLSGTVFRPQALVNVSHNITNTVLLTGDVKKPGRFPIEVSGERLLEVIAQSGSTASPKEDMTVVLTRGASTIEIPLTELETNSAENVPVLPGDVIELLHQPRTFLAFGAGKVSQVPFQTDHLSLGEAIARIGGPAPEAADPTAVYLFRLEQPAVAAKLNLPAVQTPIIYKINMMDPQSYFEIQKIAMRDKDLIYVANASSNQFFRFMAAVNSVFIPVATTATLVHN